MALRSLLRRAPKPPSPGGAPRYIARATFTQRTCERGVASLLGAIGEHRPRRRHALSCRSLGAAAVSEAGSAGEVTGGGGSSVLSGAAAHGHVRALLDAISRSDESRVRRLLDAHFSAPEARALLNRACSPSGAAPLHYAADAGVAGVLRALLDAGADPNLPANNLSTPLHWAAGKGHLDAMRVLLAAGADPTRRTFTWSTTVHGQGSGQTPLHWAAESGHGEGAKLLLESRRGLQSVEDDRKQTAVALAKKQRQYAAVAAIEKVA